MNQRLLCYYGDDFTGSTDALEALAANGVSSVLFLDPPDERRLADFPDCRALGIAGDSRSRSPDWMSTHLPPVFRSLKDYGAPVCQYKVCSTFDSSAEIGSIGRALELGRAVFEVPYVPIVVAAPHLKRYVLFANLFAAEGGEIHRIDRHPTMRHHPVTPMGESDLRLHLARQTSGKTLLLDILALHGGNPEACLDELLAQRPQAILFDGIDESSLLATGRLLWCRRPGARSFVVGSSGLTHALILYWRDAGVILPARSPQPLQVSERLIVISGSCSPVTEGQIRWAAGHGFAALRVASGTLAESEDQETLMRDSLHALSNGRSIVLYTALGPGDFGGVLPGAELSRRLGVLLRELLVRSGVRRALVAGGDTSSHAVRQLGIHALTFVAQLTPGAPLCRGHSDDPAMHGLELVLKGGQVGPENFFGVVRQGGS
jgi:uncharacterized protein YgbK (DUF1537 family)